MGPVFSFKWYLHYVYEQPCDDVRDFSDISREKYNIWFYVI